MLIGDEQCLSHRSVAAEHRVYRSRRACSRAAERGSIALAHCGHSLLACETPRRNRGKQRDHDAAHRQKSERAEACIAPDEPRDSDADACRDANGCESAIAGEERGREAEISGCDERQLMIRSDSARRYSTALVRRTSARRR